MNLIQWPRHESPRVFAHRLRHRRFCRPLPTPCRGPAEEGQDHRRQVHDRARHLGLESDQDRNRFRTLRHRRGLLGLGRQGSGRQQDEAHRGRRRSAQRRQALHQDADAERRRGRHRRRHRDGGQRHRNRALGSLRAHSAKRRSAICWAAASATASASTAPCRPSTNVEDPASWRAQAEAARAEKWGWTAFKFQGDGVPAKADPEFKEPGHDPYAAQPHPQGLPPHRQRHGDGARDARARRRFRHRMPLALRHPGRHPPGAASWSP